MSKREKLIPFWIVSILLVIGGLAQFFFGISRINSALGSLRGSVENAQIHHFVNVGKLYINLSMISMIIAIVVMAVGFIISYKLSKD